MIRCQACGFPAPEGCERCRTGRSAGSHPLPPGTQSNPLKALVQGLGFFVDGFRLGLGHPRLRPWVLVPAILSLVLFFFGLSFFFQWGDTFIRETVGSEDSSWLPGVLQWLGRLLLIPLAAIAAIFSAYVISSVLCAPVLDHIATLTEEITLGKPEKRPFSLGETIHSIVRPTIEALKLVVFETTIMGTLFVLSLFTGGVGTILFPIAGAFFAALTALDYPLTMKDYRLGQKLEHVRRWLPLYLGLGALPSCVPGLLPLTVVASTRAYLSRPVK